MFEHKYPYGDIHELNLDYLIKEVKKVDDIAAGVDGRITTLETTMETVQGDISDINGLLETQEDEIDGLQESVAPAFSEESTYAVGDKVLYDNKLWLCDIAVTEAGEWNADHWQLVNIAELIDDLGDDLETANTNISNLDTAINGEGGILERVSANETNIGSLDTAVDNLSDSIAAEYSDQLTYNVGDVVMYNNRLRVCAQAVTDPEEFDNTKWGWVRVMSAVDDLQGQVSLLGGRVTNAVSKINENYADYVAAIGAEGVGKNLLPMSLDSLKVANTVGTWSGNAYTVNDVTFTVNTDSDGNVTGINVNGTASTTTIFYITCSIDSGSYILNGCPSGGDASSYLLRAWSSGTQIAQDAGNEASFTNSCTVVDIRIAGGYNAQNIVFYPMIRTSGTSASYVPYSKNIIDRIKDVKSEIDTSVEIEFTFSANETKTYSYADLGITQKGAYRITCTADDNDNVNYGFAGLWILFYADKDTPTATNNDQLWAAFTERTLLSVNQTSRTITFTNNTGNKTADCKIRVQRI